MGGTTELSGPDLAQGIQADSVADGATLLGHANGEAVMLVRRGGEFLATGATCTHYGGPLAEGLVVGDTVRCPWHHACFDLRTGEALGAPALNDIPCYEVERRGDLVAISRKREAPKRAAAKGVPESVVVVGAGAAGAAAVESLRREGFAGPITLVGDEPPSPVDRPNLSKDYLAGNAPEEWVTLRPAEHYASLSTELVMGDPAAAIDTAKKTVTLKSGRALSYGALLLATGAEPIRLPIPGADAAHVLTLRTLADSRAIIARAEKSKRAVILGASFIALEAAASLRNRGVEVAIVAPDAVPLEKVFGREVGAFVRELHEAHGVGFHLGRKPTEIRATDVVLDDGKTLHADFVVMGVGVRPRTQLAEAAGLKTERGVLVDATFRTSDPHVYAAGDIARYPSGIDGESWRIEHWAVAERQGQAAARAIAGRGSAFRDVPFFWSAHYDVTLSYVGHAEAWDEVEIKGSLAARDAAVAYRHKGSTRALLTLGRDALSLRVEAAMERGDAAAVETLVREA